MKKFWTVLTAFAVLGMLAGAAIAQDDPAPDGGRRDRARARRLRRVRANQERMEQFVKSLELTEEQDPRFKQIMETHRQAQKNWATEHADELKAVQEEIQKAREDRDRPAMRKAWEKRGKINASRQELNVNLLKQLGEVLDKEQTAKAKRFFTRSRRRLRFFNVWTALGELDLSEKQQKQVAEIRTKARKEAQEAEGREARAKVMSEARAKTVKEVLNGEQRTKLAELRLKFYQERVLQMVARAEPTDEQKTKINAIVKEAVAKATDADNPRAQGTLLRETREKIAKDVLTEEQRGKLRPARGGDRRGRDRARGRRRGGADGDGN